MKKFLFLPFILLLFSGCTTDYSGVASVSQISNQQVLQTNNVSQVPTNDSIGATTSEVKTPKTETQSTRSLKVTQTQQSQNTQKAISKNTPIATVVCTPNWQCGDWNICTNSQQTRTCTDLNNCGVSSPRTSQSCISATPPNTTFCNGVNYSACPVGQDFVCPASGSAHCQPPVVPKTNNQSCQDSFGANSIWSGQMNSQGGLICGCATGYVWNTGGTACQLQPAPESNDQICKNSYGANSIWSGQVDNQSKPLCTCATGYMSSSDGTTCIVSDTCQKLLISYKQAEANEKTLEAGNPYPNPEYAPLTGSGAADEQEYASNLLAASQAVGQEQQFLIKLNCPLQ